METDDHGAQEVSFYLALKRLEKRGLKKGQVIELFQTHGYKKVYCVSIHVDRYGISFTTPDGNEGFMRLSQVGGFQVVGVAEEEEKHE